jgi:hypothetical protein
MILLKWANKGSGLQSWQNLVEKVNAKKIDPNSAVLGQSVGYPRRIEGIGEHHKML